MPLAVVHRLRTWGHRIDVVEPGRGIVDLDVLLARGHDAWVLKTVSGGPGLSLFDAAAAVGITTINDARAVHTVRDKAVGAALARRHGLPFPATRFAASADLLGELDTAGGPLVVKPVAGNSGRAVHLVRNPRDLDTVRRELRDEGFLLVQPYVPNPGVDYKVYSLGGDLHATVRTSPASRPPHHRPRSPPPRRPRPSRHPHRRGLRPRPLRCRRRRRPRRLDHRRRQRLPQLPRRAGRRRPRGIHRAAPGRCGPGHRTSARWQWRGNGHGRRRHDGPGGRGGGAQGAGVSGRVAGGVVAIRRLGDVRLPAVGLSKGGPRWQGRVSTGPEGVPGGRRRGLPAARCARDRGRRSPLRGRCACGRTAVRQRSVDRRGRQQADGRVGGGRRG
ncbi:ATP-grasp domain-containing protein [Yinghuangia aomiensis]